MSNGVPPKADLRYRKNARNVALLIREKVRSFREFRLDRRRHARWSGAPDNLHALLSGVNLEAQVTKDYHRIEKGLALRNPRKPFGAEVAARLADDLARLDTDAEALVQHASTAMSALRSWNSDAVVCSQVAPTLQTTSYVDALDWDGFFAGRRSVRNFSDRPVSPDVITRAVERAINAPSVCNRQAARVHHYGNDAARNVLKHQNGNAGFREQVADVLVVTVDRRLFLGVGERNQAWIDGGLFAMTLAWALHADGVGTCFLNWSMMNHQSDKLRKQNDIPDSEDVVCMLAVGYPADEARVARSPRRPVREVLRTHG